MQLRPIRALSSCLLLLCMAGNVCGQDSALTKLWEVSLSGIDKVATNNQGNIFVTDNQGYLFQYDATGNLVNELATSLSAPVTNLDAYNTVNIFLFSAALQRFEFLDRFLNPISSLSINETIASGWISQACPGNNNSLWMYDESDLNLSKYSLGNNELVQTQALNVLIQQNDLKVVLLTERNNLLFLQIAEDGLYIFDNQANFIEKIPLTTHNRPVIEGDFVYVIQEGQLIKINYLTKTSQSFALPKERNFNKLGLTSQHVSLANEKILTVYKRPKDF
ncbi:hypothetical protein Q4534_08150 [Cyclobacterium sp. 1_MG-2023]|uniref:hypothetical protein n=1 Tax=Cyclobacterium sp. 1_MG-2023 TaxID=3062681 RepID=UPI0026E30CB5|nr:hypothetical protein [Cyclobacterium sp. 1_MG-2023]MDO6437372.1 hypothetical protein [Cyclobacterium sp. 1_MG-2023]